MTAHADDEGRFLVGFDDGFGGHMKEIYSSMRYLGLFEIWNHLVVALCMSVVNDLVVLRELFAGECYLLKNRCILIAKPKLQAVEGGVDGDGGRLS